MRSFLKVNTFFVEMIVVVFFFSSSAAILISLFAGAAQLSSLSSDQNSAALMAQSELERVKALLLSKDIICTDDAPEAYDTACLDTAHMFFDEHWQPIESVDIDNVDTTGNLQPVYRMERSINTQDTDNGVLVTILVSVFRNRDNKQLSHLSTVRYLCSS